MKREYRKPVMAVEVFQAEAAVADCSRVIVTDESTYYPSQTVQCVISGSESVFNSTSGCSSSGVQFVWYNGQYYAIWKDQLNGTVSGDLNDLYPILDAAGVNYGQYGSAGTSSSSGSGHGGHGSGSSTTLYWHAGPVSSEVVPAQYGFSA